MQRCIPRVVVAAALALGAVGCAAGGTSSGGPTPSAAGPDDGRFRVLVADAQVNGAVSERDAERVTDQLRSLVNGMSTHSAVDPRIIANAQAQYGLAELDSISARQLAQQLGATNVLWTVLSPGGQGVTAYAKFVDVSTGDAIRISDATAANASQLAPVIFAGLDGQIEGFRKAATCNDLVGRSQFQQALAACDSALAAVPTSTAAQQGKATALLNLDRYQEALAVYNALIQRDGTNPEALLGAGLAASHLAQTDQALGFYNRYLQIRPGDAEARESISSRIADAGDYVSAYRVLEPAIAAPENRGDTEFQRYVFTLATAAGSKVASADGAAAAEPYYQAALSAYQLAFAADSDKPDIAQIRQVIAVNSALGRSDDALRIAREATVQYDTVAAIWSQYAAALDAAGQATQAITAYNRVLQLDPEFENIYLLRGMAALKAGQRDQAIADLRQAAQRGNQENVAKVLFAEANTALGAQQYEEAAQLLETAGTYATPETRGSISFFHGVALFRQGEAIAKANTQGQLARAREALALFQRALPLAQAGEHPSKADFVAGIEQWIANQQGVVQAASR